ncbi:MAG TPA: hypothetical protein DCM86_07640 [Verrucomicrobiales bacterium]|nr:hypothetical protein [Verrucomicrobiales bacterium]
MDQTSGDPQHEFAALRRLLALKQHEVPPPRFFDELPGRIMSRIEAERSGTWERFLDRLLATRWFQPVAAGGMAILVGTLFLSAIGTVDHGNRSTASAFMLQGSEPASTLRVAQPVDSSAPSLQPQGISR